MKITWKKFNWSLIWLWLSGLGVLICLIILQITGIGNANPDYTRMIWRWFLIASIPLTLFFFILLILPKFHKKTVTRSFRNLLFILLSFYLLMLIGRPVYAALAMPNAEVAKALFAMPEWTSLIGQLILFGLLAGTLVSKSEYLALRELPTIVFAFANDADKHLPLLKMESMLLMKHLGPLHDQGIIELYREESATLQDIIDIFDRFGRRISIFHFGGHAGEQELITETGKAHASGIAKLLQQQRENLSLVFLNGCSTLPQVDRLLEMGIKAIIATSVPIEDERAKAFAGWFYQALAGGQTLGEAFSFASASLQAKYGKEESPEIIEYRGIGLESSSDRVFPWGLYVRKKEKKVLEWRITQSS